MKKSLKRFVALASTLCLMLGAVGCGSEASPAQQSAEPDTTPQAEASTEKATIDDTENQELNIAVFQGGFGDAYWNAVVELFEKTHEGVKVNMTISPTIAEIIRPQIVAGNAPDFISLNDSAEDGLILSLIKENALLDITDVFDGDNYAGTGKLRDDIKDGLLESKKCAPYTDDKRIYLAPFNTGPQGLVYNKTAFDQKGWKIPETWDDFFALGDTVQADGRSLFTYQGIYPGYLEEMLWPAIASACGMDAIEKIWAYEEGSFNNPEVLAVLQKFADISKNGYMLPGTVGMNHTESQSEMMLGKAAFITNGTWMESEMAEAPREEGFEFAMAPTPSMKAGDTHYVLDSCEQFSIPAAAKNPELAKEFLRFLYSDESVKLFAEKAGAVMATKTGRELAKDYISTATYNMYGIYDEPNTASLIMNFEALPENCKINVSDEVFNPMISLFNGEITAEEWAESVEAAFAQIRADKAK
ncbi:N-acetylglucosamine transport system substrate-binding protein [Lachnospiraceae bacterium G11]|nr:N-acetylglucosamine transport system substrate-binding protein [Lachnospiraceae bacterium G11]